jgi:flotillin
VEVAKAEAEKIKKIGAAEAFAIEGVGKAEAERMRMKAAVYKQYGDAAIMSLVLDALPKVKHVIKQRVFKLSIGFGMFKV